MRVDALIQYLILEKTNATIMEESTIKPPNEHEKQERTIR